MIILGYKQRDSRTPPLPPPSALIVQYRADGTPTYCWQQRAGQPAVELSTPHNRVQVAGGDFAAAAKVLGVEIDYCNGKYGPKETILRTWRPGERP